jgi:molybdopterin-guanine dinucleotide biosynthesis protein A
VPEAGGYEHPLSAVYRARVLSHVERLLAAERLSPRALFEIVPTRRVSADELLDVDPELNTLKNVNEPADYLAALDAAGLRSGEG